MRSILHGVCVLVGAIIFVCFLTMTATMAGLVVTRYFFSWSFAWSEELTRYAMVWIVMLGGGVLSLFDDHIAMHVFSDALPPRAAKLQRLMVLLVVIGAAGVVAWIGYGYAISMMRVISPATGWPMTLPTLAIPIGATLMVVFALLRLIIELLPLDEGLLPLQSSYMDSSFKPSDSASEGAKS